MIDPSLKEQHRFREMIHNVWEWLEKKRLYSERAVTWAIRRGGYKLLRIGSDLEAEKHRNAYVGDSGQMIVTSENIVNRAACRSRQ